MKRIYRGGALNSKHTWNKVFKNGQSKICGRQPLKNLKAYHFKCFKDCLPQILLGPFMNTLSQMSSLNSPSRSKRAVKASLLIRIIFSYFYFYYSHFYFYIFHSHHDHISHTVTRYHNIKVDTKSCLDERKETVCI